MKSSLPSRAPMPISTASVDIHFRLTLARVQNNNNNNHSNHRNHNHHNRSCSFFPGGRWSCLLCLLCAATDARGSTCRKLRQSRSCSALSGGRCPCCTGRVGAAGARLRLWTSLCLCSDKLSRDSQSATDSVHRRSQWTFQSPQRQVRTVAVVHGGGGDEG